jgi:DDE superfamily endonuclease
LEARDEHKEAHWTLEALTAAAREQHAISVGRSQVRRILKAEGVRWRNVHPWGESDVARSSSQKNESPHALCQAARGRDDHLPRGVRARDEPPYLSSHTKLVAGRPPPLKAPLDYGRGPEKVWVYEALRVGDGQALTLTPRSRNTAGYLRLLEAVARANPRGRPLPLITDNLSSHKSPPIRECLEKHPRIEQVFIPVGACWLNLQEAWWRLFRREALAGHQTFADGEEIERAAQVATLQLNRRAKPWVWGERTSPEGIGGAHLFTAFEEQSTTSIFSSTLSSRP